jgi:DNA-binding beta-propeller fold protein YncE
MKRSVAVPLLALAACGGSTPTAVSSQTPLSPPSTAPAQASAQAPPSASPAAAASGPAETAQTRSAAERGPTQLTAKPLLLPGATAPVSLDYIVYDRARARVWVPVGDTGSVDALDVASRSFTRVDGFKTGEREIHGRRRVMGPSAVAVGDGFVYVGNRATSEVCPVDASTLKLGTCLKLPSPTDGVAYVASTKEVWVTTPRDQSLTVLDASKPDTLKMRTTIKFDGAPEGYAVDESRGLFFTNLEDKNRTVAIDVKTHKVRGAPWKPECGPDGPRGIAADAARGFVYVACTDHVQILDGARDGALLGKLDTGAGVDNIDWLETHRLLYVGAAKAAKLTIARIDDKGQPTVVATGASAEGARNPVADASGNAYVTDAANAQILFFAFAP